MSKSFKIIIALILTNAFAYSQKLLPAKILIDGDTVVAISIPQMDVISGRLIDCQRLSLADSLIDSRSKEIDQFSQLSVGLRLEIAKQANEIQSLTVLNDIRTQITEQKDRDIADLKNSNRRRLYWATPVAFVGGAFVGLLAGFLRK